MSIQTRYYEAMARNALAGFKLVKQARVKGRYAVSPFRRPYDRMLTRAAFNLGVGVSELKLALNEPYQNESMFK